VWGKSSRFPIAFLWTPEKCLQGKIYRRHFDTFGCSDRCSFSKYIFFRKKADVDGMVVGAGI